MERIDTLRATFRYQYYDQGDFATPDMYKADVRKEEKSHIRFPLRPPAYAVVEYKAPWKLSRTLTFDETEELTALLNDTASYVWGEVGTAEYDVHITFYDSMDKVIGLTNVDYDNVGQTYSYPTVKRMKWGGPTKTALNRLIEIIEGTDPR